MKILPNPSLPVTKWPTLCADDRVILIPVSPTAKLLTVLVRAFNLPLLSAAYLFAGKRLAPRDAGANTDVIRLCLEYPEPETDLASVSPAVACSCVVRADTLLLDPYSPISYLGRVAFASGATVWDCVVELLRET